MVLTHLFFQGFEANDDGWDVGGGTFNASRVASGTNGVTSQTGAFHAVAAPPSNTIPFTRYGAYSSVFPAGGFTNSIAIYLDISGGGYANDTRFDFTSAINNTLGNHRRDFAFNGGFYNSGDVTGPGAGQDRFVFSGSNSTGRPNSFPKNPGRSPIAITAEGWYTFQHRFYDGGGGQLAVDLTIKNSVGTTMGTWTLTDPSDIMGTTVGGNRYGWFANNEFSFLAFDDTWQLNNAPPATTYVDDSWAGVPFGSDPDGGGPAQFMGYDAFTTIQGGVNAVASSGTVNVLAGTYDEAVTINKPLLLDGAGGLASQLTRTAGANQALIRVDANNVTIQDMYLLVNRPFAAAGIFADESAGDDFHNLNVLSNTIRSQGAGSTLTTSFGNTSAAGVAALGGNGLDADQVTIRGNTLDSAGGGSAFSRGVWLREAQGTVGGPLGSDGNSIVATTQDVLMQFAFSNTATPSLIQNNTLLGAGVDISEPTPGGPGVNILSNDFLPVSPAFSQSLMIKLNAYPAATVTVDSNTFSGHTTGIRSGNSQNVVITNNDFTPAAGLSAFTHIEADTRFVTGSLAGQTQVPPGTGLNEITIQGNDFHESTVAGGTALAFFNRNAGFSAFTPGSIVVGGAGALANTFDNGLARFIALDAGTAVSPPTAPFGVGFDASGNQYEVTGGMKLPAAMTPTEQYELEDKIVHAVDLGTLGFVSVVANTSFVTPNSFLSPFTTQPSVQRAIDALPSGATTVNIQSGAYFGGADTTAAGKNVNVSPGTSPAQVTINGDLTLNALDTLTIELNGTNPLTQYDNFIVNGVVTLGGATLAATASPAPAGGSVYTIIDNDLVDAVNGTFAGLPNGSSLVISGTPFRIFYTAGTDSNDVQLVAGPPTITYAEDSDWDLLPLGTVLTDADQTQPGNQPGTIGYDAFNTATAVQDAINAVAAGGTTVVNPGTYAENVSVTKSLTLRGNQAGQDADTRFAAFVSGVDGPKADPLTESIITAPVNNPNGVNPGANDLLRLVADDITVDGLVIDGNNPAIAGASAVQFGGIDIDARRGITTQDNLGNFIVTSGLTIQNNIVQNMAERGVNLDNDGTAPASKHLIDANVIRSFGESGIILFWNAYTDVTNNTIDASVGDTIGLQLQNFFVTPDTMAWSGNEITVGQDSFGIHVNLFYAPGAVLNVSGNTVNAAVGVTGASDLTWGINLWSVQNNATVNVTNNVVGSAGGEFGRGINLWNLPTAIPVSLSGGSVGNSIVGINLDAVDPFFGAGDDTTVNVQNISVTANSIGLRVRSATVNAVNPNDSVRVNLTGGSFTNSPTGIQVLDSVADTFTASLQVAGSPSVTGGTTGLEIDGAETALVGNTLASTAFSGQSGQHILLGGSTLDNVEIDATAVSFNGSTGAGKTTAQNYATEDKITHGVDDSGRGFVRVRAGNVFTTPSSFIVGAADVQDAIDVAANGNTLYIQGGSYTGSANVNPVDLTISLGASPAQVVINGNLSLDGGDILVMELNGPSDATDYDNFVVNGTVSLGNGVDGFATLSATASFPYPALTFVKLIQNNLSDLTTGHFDTFADGDTIVIDGQTFLVFHNGGDGNDVILVKALTPVTPTTVYAEDAAWTDFTLGTYVDGDLSTVAFEPAFIGYNAFNNRPTTAPITTTPVQDAVDAVAVGGTVIVNDGSYSENVFVQKNLTLDGQPTSPGGANITGAGTQLVINAPATNVTIRDMTMSGAGPALFADMGLAAQLLLENLNTAGAASGGMIDTVGTVTFRTNDGVDQVIVDGDSFEEATDVKSILYATITTLNIQTLDGNDTIDAVPAGLGGPTININGGLPPNVPNPLPMGDTAGDTLNLDMTGATGPVIVSTVSGTATSASTKPLNFTQIEDINLTDGVLTNTVMGDLYIRGTSGPDTIQFSLTGTANLYRTRVNNQFYNLMATTKTIVYGREGNDNIQQTNVGLPLEAYGEANNDYIAGYTGNDLLVGGLGDDRVLGGAGTNHLWGDNVGEQDLAAGGIDQITGGAGTDFAYGGGGADIINLAGGNDYAFGGYGNDTIDGMDGDDRLYGGEGDDTISGNVGNDLIAGNGGNDKLYGKSGNDVLIGGDGADMLSGDDGNDLMFHNLAVVTAPTAGNDNSITENDGNDQAMLALLSDWALDNVLNIVTLAADTDDNDVDQLLGGTGTDRARKGTGDTGNWEFLF
jgi:hypothetical protein